MPVNPNLLSITTIPIKIDITVIQGRLQNPNAPEPEIRIKTGEGGIKIDAQPVNVRIDTYAARASMGLGKLNYDDFYRQEADKGKSLASQGTKKRASEGSSFARGATTGQIAKNNIRASFNVQTMMEHIPKEKADITFTPGALDIRYDMKDLDISFVNTKIVPLEYRPGRVEFNISQMPRCDVEYIGGPIYVPPSAAPDYDLRV